MDAKRAYNDHRWTNERHLHFLKSLEASFVRTMLENSDDRVFLPMDRYVPDSCESTLDSKRMTTATTATKRRKRNFPADYLDPNISIEPRITKFRLHPSTLPQEDQIVPQIKRIKTEDDDNIWTNLP
ncbi:uncharacterized protein LOC111901767 [Lactuca sativa]|uniref:Uncharacterized protein n=1 Tax=Lactuca sativa TaxID=4236 RepID=A0A9R1WSG9_LACSA|nr:uncharacterized protein LOC111901767 [Lactuca sativa]KAJ0184697.1 hypothetical protein LSAT_V11C900478830 [Lactuca sativa]